MEWLYKNIEINSSICLHPIRTPNFTLKTDNNEKLPSRDGFFRVISIPGDTSLHKCRAISFSNIRSALSVRNESIVCLMDSLSASNA